MKRLPWFQFRDHSRGVKHWGVYFVDRMPTDSADAVGVCNLEEREIYILATEPARAIAKILGHEILHAACAHWFANNDLAPLAEESVANAVEPSLLPIMASLGAKFPPFPEGFDAFRRAARKR